jgi:hypothetical protein
VRESRNLGALDFNDEVFATLLGNKVGYERTEKRRSLAKRGFTDNVVTPLSIIMRDLLQEFSLGWNCA